MKNLESKKYYSKMFLSIKEIQEREKQKKDSRKEIYTRILQQVNRRIEMAYNLGSMSIVVKIPEFILGLPNYNIEKVTIYIHRQLLLLGFRATIVTQGLIHVAWGKPEKQTKEQREEDTLPSLANLKKAANTLRKKYTQNDK